LSILSVVLSLLLGLHKGCRGNRGDLRLVLQHILHVRVHRHGNIQAFPVNALGCFRLLVGWIVISLLYAFRLGTLGYRSSLMLVSVSTLNLTGNIEEKLVVNSSEFYGMLLGHFLWTDVSVLLRCLKRGERAILLESLS